MFSHYSDVLTIYDLMEMLQVGQNTAYRLIKVGEIKSVRVGRMHRIPRESVIEFLHRNNIYQKRGKE